MTPTKHQVKKLTSLRQSVTQPVDKPNKSTFEMYAIPGYNICYQSLDKLSFGNLVLKELWFT